MGGPFLLFFLPFLSLCSISVAHNITEILSNYPDLKTFSDNLTETKLADEINSRKTVTVLALSNDAMSHIADASPADLKTQLSLHVLLDYFDNSKLHNVRHGTAQITTLFQTTGRGNGMNGFVNITDLKGGKVSFRSTAAHGHRPNSSPTYVKSVKQIPYIISVIQISAPIDAPGVQASSAPPASSVNITAVLIRKGCATFASLLASSDATGAYASAVAKGGLTVFAPLDRAFNASRWRHLGRLARADLASLLLYHGADGYNPIGTLKLTKVPISTLASNGTQKFRLKVTASGDKVTLKTGVDSSRISSTAIDSPPMLCIHTVDSVLLPPELFGKSPSPAPATAPAPPKSDSPPAPPSTSTPEESPADSPGADSADTTSATTPPASAKPLVAAAAVAASVIFSSFLS